MTGSASKAHQGNTGVSNPTANKAKPSNKRQPYEFKWSAIASAAQKRSYERGVEPWLKKISSKGPR